MSSGFINPSAGVIRGSSPDFVRVLFGDGDATEPSFAFKNDPDTGFYRSGANEIGISCGGIKVGFFSAGGKMTLDHVGGANPKITFKENGLDTGSFQLSSASAYISANSSVILRTGGTTAALTLDLSQNATFHGTSILFANTAGRLTWNGRGGILSSGNGILRLTNDANTDFGRLQFGGTTNTFPALKRTGVDLRVVKADDSGETSIVVAQVYATSNIYNFGSVGTRFLRSGAGSPEGAINADVGSMFLRTDGGAGTTLYVKESGAGNIGWVAK